jgi:hypothetical protein
MYLCMREIEREGEREEINSQQLEPQSQTEDLWSRMSLHLAWDWALDELHPHLLYPWLSKRRIPDLPTTSNEERTETHTQSDTLREGERERKGMGLGPAGRDRRTMDRCVNA